MGRPRTSPLVPIFRSDAQARLLATVFLSDESLHVRAIADRAQLPYSVVQREIDRLEDAGILRSTRFATSRVVRANERHPLYPELRALLLKAYGPTRMLSELVNDLEPVDAAFLFGSWAARYNGEWGGPSADIDVLLIGSPDPRRVEEVEAMAEDRLGYPVQITVVSPEAWAERASGFVRTVLDRPLVPLNRKDA